MGWRRSLPVALVVLLAVTVACGPGTIEEQGREVPRHLVAFAPVAGIDISHWSGYITDAQVNCWWDQGIRHVIAGTQVPDRTVHQLEKLVQGGMSVDAYVWLYWDQDAAHQVEVALGIVQDFPVERLWLDAEDNPGSLTTGQIETKIQAGLDACGGFSCGIYTRKSWWDEHMADSGQGSTVFSSVPLWYANYDSNASLNTWSYQKFGGWESPTGKQYTNTVHLCGVPVDRDTIYATYTPGGAGTPQAPSGMEPDGGETLTAIPVALSCEPVDGALGYEFGIERLANGTYLHVDTILAEAPAVSFAASALDSTYRWRVRATNDVGWGRWSSWASFNVLLPDDLEPVPAPGGLSPDHGDVVPPGGVALSCDPVPGGVSYEFEVWIEPDSYYTTYLSGTCQKTFFPVIADSAYLWRVRARVGGEWGMWSLWASFFYGDPPAGDDPAPGGDTLPAPTGLQPTDDDTVTGASVTLSCDPLAGASLYEFAVEYWTGSAFVTYYNYLVASSSKTFYPQYQDSIYRFRVRADNGSGWGTWSDWATFRFGDVAGDDPPGDDDPAPDGDVPASPGGLDPDGGANITGSSVTLSCSAVEGAREYEFEIQYHDGSAYHPYYTYTTTSRSKTFYPQFEDTSYRWRVRASNAYGPGNWSLWAGFTFNAAGGGDGGGDDPPADDVPPAPSGLAPDGGQLVSGSSVTLSCSSVQGATQYEFAIEFMSGSAFAPYYTYATSSPSKVFYPQNHDTEYRFRVRAGNASGWSAWSYWAEFLFD